MRSRQFIRRGLIAGLATLAMAYADAPAFSARVNFDGPWSVLVVTDYGTCDRAYRYGVEIQNGRLFYRGDASVNISGRVSPGGQVSVVVRQGNQQASGSGQLSQDSGGGNWKGASPDQQCGGRWTAERRNG